MLAIISGGKLASRPTSLAAFLSLAASILSTLAAEPKFSPIDLSAHVQKKWSDIQPGTSWAAVPRGLQVIGGTPFKLDGILEVTGMGAARAGDPRPAQVSGIPVNAKATHIHILQGAGYNAPDGTPIAALTLNFANGETRSIPIRYGTHVRNWWVERSETTGRVSDPNSETAWTGSSPETEPRGVTLRLFRSRFVNPLPGQEIRSIDFSSLFSRATPVMVGLAIENSSPGDLKEAEETAAQANEYLASSRNAVSLELQPTGSDNTFDRTRVHVEVEEHGRAIDLGSFKSDSSGHVRLFVPPTAQSLTYTVQGEDFLAARGSIQLSRGEGATPVRVALTRGALLGGKVQTPDSQPIPGANIALSVATPGISGEIGQIETDPSGNWQTASVPTDYTALDFTVTHPDYLPADYEQASEAGPQSVTKSDLLARKALFVLKPAPAISGTVKDPAGQPVAGAEITLRLDPLRILAATSDKSGAFRITIPQAQTADLLVQADGYAPLSRVLSLSDGNARVELQLDKGQPLKGRVVETENTPAPSVQVAVDSWNGFRNLKWRTETDADGRYVWENAPSGPIVLSFTKPGYQTQTVTADSSFTSEDIRIAKRFKLSGKVVDAETKQPLHSFTVTPGNVWGGPDENVQWDRQRTINGENGAYTASGDMQGGELRYLIAAQGYQPVASPVFIPVGWHTFDAELKKAQRPEGVVLNKDGQPVEKAAIATLGNGYLMLSAGRLRTHDRTRPYVETDSQGRFQLEEALGSAKVIFVHEQFGYAETTMDDLRAKSEVKLQPWAKIEGQLKIGSTNAGAGRDLMLANPRHIPGDLSYDYEKYKRTTDENGRFTIDFVPPGERQIIRLIPILRGSGWSHYTRFTIQPGETKNIVIGGVGRPVIGKLAVSDPDRQINWRAGHHSLGTTFPKPPGRFNSSEEARAWQRSPEVQDAQRNHRSYTLEMSDDGSFVISDVPAGAYTLRIHLTEPGPRGGFGGEFIGSLEKEVLIEQIPGGQTDEPLDLGTLTIQLKKDLKTGMAAPPIEAKTLDDQPFNLKDLAGKFVLLDFWATWCGPCVAEIPSLKAAFEKHGQNPNFAMVSLSLDPGVKEPRDFIKNKHLPWHQLFLGEWSKTTIPNAYGVTGIPATFLLDPEGKIVEKNLRGDDLLRALDKHLTKTTAAR